MPIEDQDPQDRYLWFVELLNDGWEQPPRLFDPDWWAWQEFAAGWARELLGRMHTSA